MTDSLRADFLLDEAVVFLNHGSFGACPRPVFEAYQRWQLELERQPVEFLGRRHQPLMDAARAALAAYLNAAVDELVFVPNATIGVNLVARSIRWQPGDEILTSDHEYGAVDKTWQFVAERGGARIVRQTLPIPLQDPAQVVEALWAGVTPRTKVIALSHITSPTALRLPVAEICQRAREAGILTVIDGAHAPGQIDLDLQAIGADFYTGNCHKWLCAPKGSAFLVARSEHHVWLDPLVTSWGWGIPDESFISRNQWQGTRDIAAFLTVPEAIAYQRAHDWPQRRAACEQLAHETQQRLSELIGLAPQAAPHFYNQMVAVPLPVGIDGEALKRRLYDEFRVEIPITEQGGQRHIRAALQVYNTRADADALLDALAQCL